MKKYVIPTGEYIYLHSLTLDSNNINLYCTDKEGEKFTLTYNKNNCQNLLSFLKIKDLASNELMKMIELDEPQEIEIVREKILADDKIGIVKHGQWITHSGCGLLKCSCCGYEYSDRIGCMNFCGNCGAKMDKGDKNEM